MSPAVANITVPEDFHFCGSLTVHGSGLDSFLPFFLLVLCHLCHTHIRYCITMRFTAHHDRSEFQRKVESRGAYLSAMKVRVQKCGAEDAPEENQTIGPNTKPEMKAAQLESGMKDVPALQENAQMTETVEQQLMDAAIAAGLKNLAARFLRNAAVPEVPDDIFTKANSSIPEDMQGPYEFEDLDLEYWLDFYPALDEVTAEALLEQSDNDLFPNFGMMAFGAHFVSQSWTDAEFRQWYEGMNGLGGSHFALRRPAWPTAAGTLTRKNRAKLLAQLSWDVLNYSNGGCVHRGNLEHTAGLVKELPLQELNMEADQAGINVADRNNKAALVLALTEHIYSDVLEPSVTA